MRSPKSRKEGSMRINGRRMMMARLLDDMFARIDDAVAREIILKNWGEADGKHVLVSKLAEVTNIGSLFNGSAVVNIDWLKYFSGLIKASAMFSNCTSILSADLQNCVSSHITNLNNMFAGCTGLKNIDCSDWDVSKVTELNGLFKNCSSLTSLNLSGWNVSHVSDFSWLFAGCSSLKELDLSSWKTSNVTNMYNCFAYCTSLETINLSGWNFNDNVNLGRLFYGTTGNIKKVILNGVSDASVAYFLKNFGVFRPKVYQDEHIWVFSGGKWIDEAATTK